MELPPSSSSESSATQNSDISNGSFAFFVHSQDALNHSLPPSVDNKAYSRQRRRRTSPEDHAILEAEYQRNPKPDKAARMQIVERVALGEKEVQIWFQNRRQNTRRKSRPILAEEIDPFSRTRGASTDNVDCSSFPSENVNTILPPSEDGKGCSVEWKTSDAFRLDVKDAGTNLRSSETLKSPIRSPREVDLGSSSQTTPASLGTPAEQNHFVDSSQPEGSRQSEAPQIRGVDVKPFSTISGGLSTVLPGYISNRRSAPSGVMSSITQPLLRSSFDSSCTPIEPRCYSAEDPHESLVLKRTSSLVRLSMSLDGKAKVITNDENSPSPPRVQPSTLASIPRESAALQRSTSVSGAGSRLKEGRDMRFLPWPRRTISGRSRDARTWEFYCDSDTRNALTAQAEQEQSGSAVGAIALIKSRHSKTLAPNANKRNLQASRAAPIKRVKPSSHLEKPKLSRAASSMARLETVDASTENELSRVKTKGLNDGTQRSLLRSPSGDSDKENWEPGTHTANVRRRRLPEAQGYCPRPVLRENLEIISQSSSLGAVLHRENTTPSRNHRKDTVGGDEDREVAEFMGESSVSREEEDLDCVQNLLSLSQGAWR